jgi:hypothetical protein
VWRARSAPASKAYRARLASAAWQRQLFPRGNSPSDLGFAKFPELRSRYTSNARHSLAIGHEQLGGNLNSEGRSSARARDVGVRSFATAQAYCHVVIVDFLSPRAVARA